MNRRLVLVIVFFGVVVLVLMVYSSLNLRQFRVEVCKEFAGRQACRVASASTREGALAAATQNACALISSGVTDSIACQNSEPVRVNWLKQ